MKALLGGILSGLMIVSAGAAFAQAQGVGAVLNEEVIANYGPAGADPLEYDDGTTRLPNGHVGDTLTLGDAIQGGFYGNAANTDGTNNGHGTLPSLAPGPEVCVAPGCDTTTDGATWGDFKQVFNPAAQGLAPAP